MTPGPRRIVIVGNGIAGVTAADALRSHGHDGELTIVGGEPRPAYSRPALSKALLRAEADLDAHELPPPTHAADERLGVRAVGLDPERRRLRLDDGETLEYDGLVIASGSQARRLGRLGDEHVLRTLEDAIAIRERIAAGADVVIVGAGPLGMETASGALERGCRVTIVATSTPMSRVLGARLGAMLTAAAAARGAEVLRTPSARLVERGGRSAVELADGRIVIEECLVTAVGDLPDTGWLGGLGVAAGDPLRVDGRGRLRPGIVAAGDVAAFPDRHGRHVRSPLWHSAIAQASAAAAGLLRGEEAPELRAAPYFWTEQFGRTVRAVGPMPPSGEPERLDGDGESVLLRWRDVEMATAVAVDYRIPIPRLRRLIEPDAA